MIEEWRNIPNYEGLYQASSLGRVRSLNRTISVYDPRTNKHMSQYKKGKILTPNRSGKLIDNNIAIRLCKNGIHIKKHVGCWILDAFIGVKPKGYNITCSHRDGNALNNKPNNLLWESQQSNCLRKKDHGTIAEGEKNGTAKLTNKIVLMIKQDIVKAKYTLTQIAFKYGTTLSIVSRINCNKTWTCIPWPKEIVSG